MFKNPLSSSLKLHRRGALQQEGLRFDSMLAVCMFSLYLWASCAGFLLKMCIFVTGDSKSVGGVFVSPAP